MAAIIGEEKTNVKPGSDTEPNFSAVSRRSADGCVYRRSRGRFAGFILEVGPLMAVGVDGVTFLGFYAALGRQSRRSEILREFEGDETGGLRFAYSVYFLGTPALLIVVGLLLIYAGGFAG